MKYYVYICEGEEKTETESDIREARKDTLIICNGALLGMFKLWLQSFSVIGFQN